MQKNGLRFFLFLLLTISLWVLNSNHAYANPQPVGQMVWVKGTVKAIAPDKTTRVLERRSIVYEQDTIVTDKTSTGQIVFTDNTLLALSEDTTIEIKKYNYSKGKSPSQDEYLVDIAKGGFRSITGAIAKSNRENYKVNTPVATIGVRGTEYSVVLDAQGKAFMRIEKGSIVIETANGRAILTQGTDQLYAQIAKGMKPVITQTAPAIFEKSSPPVITPAQSTLQPSSSSNSANTVDDGALPLTSTSSTGSGGSSGSSTDSGGSSGSPTGSGGSKSSGSSKINSDGTVSSFCIQ